MAWRQTWNEPPDKRAYGPRPRRPMGGHAPGVKFVLVATIGVFILDTLSRGQLSALGALSVEKFLPFGIWRLFSYQFLHAGFGHIFWNMFLFWMLGSALERQIGTRHFLYLYFLSGVVGGLFEVGFNFTMFQVLAPYAHPPGRPDMVYEYGRRFLTMPVVGASAGVSGVMVAFAVRNPRALFLIFFILPVEARWVAIVYLVTTSIYVWSDLATALQSQGGVQLGGTAHAAHLGGMVMGFLWIKYGDRVLAWWQSKRGGGPRRSRGPTPPEQETKERAELDRILEKVHNQGVASLTTREKMFLQEMSRKYRGRF